MFVTDAYGQETAPSVEGGHGAPADAGHAAGTEVPHESGHGEAGFPPFDPSTFPSQILWVAITFGLFYLFLKKVIMPRLAGILEVRENRIAKDIDEATRMKGEADAAVAAYEQELAAARANANVIGQKARDGAKAEAETTRKSIEAESRKQARRSRGTRRQDQGDGHAGCRLDRRGNSRRDRFGAWRKVCQGGRRLGREVGQELTSWTQLRSRLSGRP